MTTLYLICIVIAIGILLAQEGFRAVRSATAEAIAEGLIIAMGAFVVAVEFMVDLTRTKS